MQASVHYLQTNRNRFPMRTALLCIDFINDIVHPDGKIAGKGYADFAAAHDIIRRTARIQDQFRQQSALIVHARVQFSQGYYELNEQSLILGAAKKNEALMRKTWGTEFITDLAPREDEPTITKHRVSPFYRTRLELILNSQKTENLFICGGATNLAIETAAREAHDRDYNVTVLADACFASDEATHQKALESMAAFADVKNFSDVAAKLTA